MGMIFKTLGMGLVLGVALTSAPAMARIPGGSGAPIVAVGGASDVEGIRVARRGADDGANHDANDDHGRRGRGDDRGRGRGRGLDDGPNHDAGDDHGRRGRGDDRGRGRGRGSDDAQLERTGETFA